MTTQRPHARAWIGLFVTVVFGAGVATGLLLQRYLEPPAAADPAPPFPGPSPGARLTTLMVDELELTPDQQQQLAAIVAARRQKLVGLRHDLRLHFEREATEVEAEIAHILTPEQQERFASLTSRMRARFRVRSPMPPPARE
jgi:Spy/CpxP family protein refolding chaperone